MAKVEYVVPITTCTVPLPITPIAPCTASVATQKHIGPMARTVTTTPAVVLIQVVPHFKLVVVQAHPMAKVEYVVSITTKCTVPLPITPIAPRLASVATPMPIGPMARTVTTTPAVVLTQGVLPTRKFQMGWLDVLKAQKLQQLKNAGRQDWNLEVF